ncbi:MAG: hypothetical protein HN926_09865 [Chloroflexi bacterium]|jgi:hypothetical protein|nr:hypothetical protein [Chloroflexota bacterium]MBT3863071.1 hypothetical protein [Chloroflexota bacterium]MBT4142607.1 hypothetical protein [Chloroflexota bacterium]MBT4340458.1 hypothetical protein [Chloroflexota bacterium]MBT4943898.1 hypothetical protein [Chloroflexota bacterium]
MTTIVSNSDPKLNIMYMMADEAIDELMGACDHLVVKTHSATYQRLG